MENDGHQFEEEQLTFHPQTDDTNKGYKPNNVTFSLEAYCIESIPSYGMNKYSMYNMHYNQSLHSSTQCLTFRDMFWVPT